MPLERQRESFALLRSIVDRDLGLDDKDAARELFTRLTGLYKNLNYSAAGSPEYTGYRRQIDELLGAGATER
jgi:V/A-type H+-transporting ATPase subunit A